VSCGADTAGGLCSPRWTVSVDIAVAAERDQDRRLLARIAGGDARAWRRTYDVYAPRAMAVALRLLRDRGEAEDVVQETFIELWRRAAQFDAQRGAVVAWVVAIARSRAIDRLRAERSGRRAVEAAAAHLTPSPQADPEALVGLSEELERVQRALKTLPDKQRLAAELAYFAGLSHAEIARATDQPLGTVKMRLRLARDSLTTWLANLATVLDD
jgi:RNA polymerase sigma-70 factor (ECF subfamily)